MRNGKTVCLFLILLLVTAGMILLPPTLSGQRRAALLTRTVYREQAVSDRIRVTASQVARLYNTRKIGFGPYNSMFLYEADEAQQVRAAAAELLKPFFAEDTAVGKSVLDALEDSEVFYSRNSILINAYDQPVALIFMEVGIRKGGVSVELMYEEKTKTLVRFSYDTPELLCENEEHGKVALDAVMHPVREYYENTLKLGTEDYYLVGGVGTGNHATLYGSSYFSFGIAQNEVKSEAEIGSMDVYRIDTR